MTNTVIFKTNPSIIRTNPVVFWTTQVVFKTNSVIFRTDLDFRFLSDNFLIFWTCLLGKPSRKKICIFTDTVNLANQKKFLKTFGF